MLLAGIILGALLMLVAVCAAEPNYRELVNSERDDLWRRELTKPVTVSIEDKQSGGMGTLIYQNRRIR